MAVGTGGLLWEQVALARLPDSCMAVDTVTILGVSAGVMLPGLVAPGAAYKRLMAGGTGTAACRHLFQGDR